MIRRLALAACTGAAVLVAGIGPAGANAAHTPRPYFVQWKPGTPLPKVPKGYEIRALPSQRAEKALRRGQFEHTVLLNPSSPRSMAAVRANAANAAGIVNLEIMPVLTRRGKVVPACSSAQLLNSWLVVTNLGQQYSTADHIHESFTYGQSQSSSLEIGYSTSGANGSWSGDGTLSVSKDTGGTENYPWIIGQQNDTWQTQFRIGKYSEVCNFQPVYLLKPMDWAGGATYDTSTGGVPATPYCAIQRNGTEFQMHSSSATTFNVGFNIVGFGGSAQTGYSTNAEANFMYYQDGHICGRDGDPGATPGQLNAAN